MKEVILIRHGKSSWDYRDVSDRDRPLSNRGIKDAGSVSNYLRERIEVPELVYSSAANRALHTAMIFMRGLNVDPKKVMISETLYSFSDQPIIRFIKNLSEDYDRVMIFGHNPAFTSISNFLGSKPIDNLPTSGVVQMKFEVPRWEQLNKGLTEIVVFPKLLQ
ncbi:phosphohistidine phosphatase, SixA [Galbibacter marinus]|uniref:Phosphohistidine phosphatase, SixA n=1 Tax=Galbibacter marinus TaxID=555500 RepID=K2PTW3_9FLAO|nr:histidine phosphatase family protein [Galbibacter marinus]EKF55019.1 phosphohistidine phosphatase, SixA [Galbibacter marinus]